MPRREDTTSRACTRLVVSLRIDRAKARESGSSADGRALRGEEPPELARGLLYLCGLIGRKPVSE